MESADAIAPQGSDFGPHIVGLTIYRGRREPDLKHVYTAFAVVTVTLAAAPQTAFETARKLEEAGQYGEAEHYYRAVLQQAPRSVPALANLGVVLARQGKYADAITMYKSALKLDPSATAVKLNLGIAYIKTGGCANAVPLLAQVLKADPADRRTRQLLAICLLELGRFTEAVKSFDVLLPSTDVSILLGAATAYIKTGRLEEGKRMLDGIVRDHGDSPGVQLTLGMAALGVGDYDAAETAFKRALASDAANADAHFYIGAVAFKRNDFEGAIREWKEAVRLNPNHFAATLALGALMAEQGGYAEAKPLLERAAVMRPDIASIHVELGRVALQEQRFDFALHELTVAVRLDPKSKTASFLRADALRRLGKGQEARAEFDRGRALADSESTDLVGSVLK